MSARRALGALLATVPIPAFACGPPGAEFYILMMAGAALASAAIVFAIWAATRALRWASAELRAASSRTTPERVSRAIVATGVIAAIAVVIVLIGVPFEGAMTPAIRVQLVDARGAPLQDLSVDLFWTANGASLDRQHAKGRSDAAGVVAFPEQRDRLTVAARALRGPITAMVQPDCGLSPSPGTKVIFADRIGNGARVELRYYERFDRESDIVTRAPRDAECARLDAQARAAQTPP